MTYAVYATTRRDYEQRAAMIEEPNWTVVSDGHATAEEADRAAARHSLENWIEGQDRYSTAAYMDALVYSIREVAAA